MKEFKIGDEVFIKGNIVDVKEELLYPYYFISFLNGGFWISHEDLESNIYISDNQKYVVEIPNGKEGPRTFLVRKRDKVVLDTKIPLSKIEDKELFCLTEREIKRDFKWAWDAGFAKKEEDVDLFK